MNKLDFKSLNYEQAKSELEKALFQLAQNAVYNKRLISYVEELDQYVGELMKKKEEDEKNDEPEAE